MKKLLITATLLIASSMAMISCDNGDYDANPNTNNSSTPIPVNTGGGGGNNGSFNWSGTDPLSAKIDGQGFQATSDMYNDLAGFIGVAGYRSSENIAVSFPLNATVGSVYNTGGTTSIVYNTGATTPTSAYNTSIGGASGSIKILEKDATHVKGLFYGTVKNTAGASKVITEGYFNIKK